MAMFTTANMRDFAALVFLIAGYYSELFVPFADWLLLIYHMPLCTEHFQCFSKDYFFFFFDRNLSIEYQVQFRGQIRGRETPCIPEKQLNISE